MLLIAALLVVNANLGLALHGLRALTKLLSLLAIATSSSQDRTASSWTDPTSRGSRTAIVNAPVLAWCGLEYYAVAGGQLLGLVVGLVVGLLLSRSVGSFRRRMLAAQGNPSRLQALAANPLARFAMWLFFGGKGKKTWEDKLGKKMGNPVRIWGAALMVLVLAGTYAAHATLAGPFARRGLRAGLEETNGATVDVGEVELDLTEGRFAVAGLALADPNALEQDFFRAAHLEAKIDQADLLRKRVHVARIVVKDAQSGVQRERAGERITPKVVEVAEEARDALPSPGDYSLEEVITEYKVWKERLGQARHWLDKLAGEPTEDAEAEAAGGETFAERVEREARERGWLAVQAGHLVDEAPTFRLSELVVDGLTLGYMPETVFDLHAKRALDPSAAGGRAAAPRARVDRRRDPFRGRPRAGLPRRRRRRAPARVEGARRR